MSFSVFQTVAVTVLNHVGGLGVGMLLFLEAIIKNGRGSDQQGQRGSLLPLCFGPENDIIEIP